MAAAKKHLLIEQKATFVLRLKWRTSKGRPVDLTGYTANMQVRASAASAVILLDLSSSAGDITITPGEGIIEIIISDEDTALITWATGVYDLILTNPAGQKTRIIEGKVTVSSGVTSS